MEKTQRIKELVDLLNTASKAYYQEDNEIISNLEYDNLYDELLRLEEETGLILSNSPTVNVGYEALTSLPKEQHESPMLSLDKTKNPDDLVEWLKDKDGVLSWKLDGLTIVLTYRDGKLLKAVTRGNGEVGEVITNNAKTFKNLPMNIKYKDELVIRGEAVIRYSDFNKINEEIEDVNLKYKNPRNLCSGSVRQLNNEITSKRSVHFFAFSLVNLDNDDLSLRSKQLDWLKGLGFDGVEWKLVDRNNIKDVIHLYADKISQNDFPSDGLVLSFNDIKYGKSLGSTSKFPRDSIAFKWADEQVETILKEIEWSASRTGLINPIAIFEPVDIEGTTVSRASVHNLSILEDLELGIGDKIKVYKANMIIPQISENLTRSNNISIPTNCPVCGHETKIKNDNNVKTLFCINEDCMAKKLKKFTHFVSRDAINIDGLSESTIQKFIENSFLVELIDLYKLNRYEDEIINIEGYGKKSYNNLIKSIEKSRNTTLAKFVFSLGIPNIGLSNAKLICKYYSNDINAIQSAEIEDLMEIEGIGEIIAESIVMFFKKEENIITISQLLNELIIQKEVNEETEVLKDLNFVITGSVEIYANRNELKEYIESLGGKVTASVTSKTNYLINNDNTSNSSKNKKAKELGIEIITEEEFVDLVRNR